MQHLATKKLNKFQKIKQSRKRSDSKSQAPNWQNSKSVFAWKGATQLSRLAFRFLKRQLSIGFRLGLFAFQDVQISLYGGKVDSEELFGRSHHVDLVESWIRFAVGTPPTSSWTLWQMVWTLRRHDHRRRWKNPRPYLHWNCIRVSSVTSGTSSRMPQ